MHNLVERNGSEEGKMKTGARLKTNGRTKKKKRGQGKEIKYEERK